MDLVEIARFTDVYEADLAAAFLASHDIEVSVTERHQTTVDPLMQRALGIRLMGPAGVAAEARELLARAQAGEFVETDEGEPVIETPGAGAVVVGSIFAVLLAGGGVFWGTGRPRRLRVVHWIGLGLIAVFAAIGLVFWVQVLTGS